MLRSMGSQRVGHDLVTELTELRFVTAILLRSKSLLILWLQSLSALVLEPRKMKSGIDSTFSSSVCHEVMGLDAMILVSEC